MKSIRLLALIAPIALIGGCTTAPRDAARSTAIVDFAALDQIPVARHMTPPEFPPNLREPGSTGSAMVAFVVDADGNVRDAQAVQATRQEFGVAAVQAVSRWKFRPGRKGGRNVPVRMTVPVEFQIVEPARAAALVGAALDSVFETAALDQLPVVRYMAKPVYPRELQEQKITGRAVIMFVVDAQGNVRDPRVVDATRPEFGLAAQEAVSQWKFRPGQKGGRKVNVLMRVPVAFDVSN